MKKTVCALLSLMLIFSFAACSDGKKESSVPTNDTSSEEKKPDTKDMEMLFDDFYDFKQDGATAVKSSDTKKIKVSLGTEIRAIGVADSPVPVTVTFEDGHETIYNITVKKTKLNIVILGGQSNAVGATSGVPQGGFNYVSTECIKGTSFIWGAQHKVPIVLNGGTATDGIRPAFAAQWYELSKKAGNIEKTVIIWANNHTSTSGEKIDEFFIKDGERATVEKTAKMINDCFDYYTTGAGSQGFDIVNCGVYWFQGESDVSMAPETYEQKFMNYFNGLNSLTSNRVKYCAFFRIRGGGGALTPNGPVTAQQNMANNNDNMYMASVLTEQWKGDGKNTVDVDISKYDIFGEDQYKNIISGTTLTEKQENIYGGLHYRPLGFNILGADAAVNMYPLLHK